MQKSFPTCKKLHAGASLCARNVEKKKRDFFGFNKFESKIKISNKKLLCPNKKNKKENLLAQTDLQKENHYFVLNTTLL